MLMYFVEIIAIACIYGKFVELIFMFILVCNSVKPVYSIRVYVLLNDEVWSNRVLINGVFPYHIRVSWLFINYKLSVHKVTQFCTHYTTETLGASIDQ